MTDALLDKKQTGEESTENEIAEKEPVEKRRSSRKILAEPAQVLDGDTGVLVGVLEDISRDGFSILTGQPVLLSEVKKVTIILPGPQESTHRINMLAECVWCQSGNKQGDHSRDYAAGFQLREIEEQDAVALNYFMRDY